MQTAVTVGLSSWQTSVMCRFFNQYLEFWVCHNSPLVQLWNDSCAKSLFIKNHHQAVFGHWCSSEQTSWCRCWWHGCVVCEKGQAWVEEEECIFFWQYLLWAYVSAKLLLCKIIDMLTSQGWIFNKTMPALLWTQRVKWRAQLKLDQGPVAKEYMSANFTVCSLVTLRLNSGRIFPLMQAQAYEMLWASCFLHYVVYEIDNPYLPCTRRQHWILYSGD